MGYGYMSDPSGIRIEWKFEGIDSDEDIPRPNNCVDFIMDKFREKICEEFLTAGCDDNEWDEFKAGLSMTADKVLAVTLLYRPLEKAVLHIIKRNCPKCGKPCGLASTYCDGTGKATATCQECGKTNEEILHRSGCSWNR